ncbi:ATP-binding protein [Kitasatospora sp. NPDC001159]
MHIYQRMDGGIPAETTSLVGRRRELARIRQLLYRTRLLTVTGAGGTGKSRVALRTARDLRDRFPDGVRMVDLVPVRDGDHLAQSIALALGLDHDGTRPAQDLLTEHLAERRLLMVLDNCEHLADHCAHLVHTLLTAAPGLHILTTSRRRLGVYGEYILDLRPLATPDPDRLPEPEALIGFPAVRLFAQRARAVVDAFPRTPDDWTTAALICRRLDGIPLAIELAAAWLRVLPAGRILDHLEECPELPGRPGHATPARHRTLHAAIARSYHLCDGAERRLWAALSVFTGGFDLAAAEAVCRGDGLTQHDVLHLLAALVDKSVLTRKVHPREDHPGEERYRMLETIRHYGLSRLRAEHRERRIRRRHLHHYRDLAARAESEWFSPCQSAWLARLRRDHANLRAAVEFGLTTPGEVHGVLDLVASLWSHRLGRGGLEEERHWLGRVLAAGTGTSTARAKALWADGWLALLRGDTPTATARVTECHAIGEQLDHAPTRARARQLEGLAALFDDDFTTAIHLLEDALAQYRADGDPGATWTTLFLLTVAGCMAGDPRAADHGRQSLALCDAHDARWSRRYALWALGLDRWLAGRPLDAGALLQDALRHDAPEHNLFAVAQALEVLAWVAAAEGSGAHGAVLLGAAQALWQRIGVALPALGRLLHHRAICEERLREALAEAELADALREGGALTVQQAVSRALGWTPLAPPKRPPATPLTTREGQVVELLAEGLTDKQIAARLVLSPRTVEGHVQRILAKLGFTSRVQVATWSVGGRTGGR